MSSITDPAWLAQAWRHLGTREIRGPQHEPKILGWWKAIKRGGIKDDETPWCAAFVGGCLEAVGLMSSQFESAKSYLDWGMKMDQPEVGCVVVFQRDGGGHVGFVVGRDPMGRLMVLGGNQSDEVNVRAFSHDRVIGYRWPKPVPLPAARPLPLIAAGELSRSEA